MPKRCPPGTRLVKGKVCLPTDKRMKGTAGFACRDKHGTFINVPHCRRKRRGK